MLLPGGRHGSHSARVPSSHEPYALGQEVLDALVPLALGRKPLFDFAELAEVQHGGVRSRSMNSSFAVDVATDCRERDLDLHLSRSEFRRPSRSFFSACSLMAASAAWSSGTCCVSSPSSCSLSALACCNLRSPSLKASVAVCSLGPSRPSPALLGLRFALSEPPRWLAPRSPMPSPALLVAAELPLVSPGSVQSLLSAMLLRILELPHCSSHGPRALSAFPWKALRPR